MKECSKCHEKKPDSEFYRKETGKKRLTSYCKGCFKVLTKVPVPSHKVPPKTYQDYLREAGMLEYYKRCQKYSI